MMNHIRILCRSVFTICDSSLRVSFSWISCLSFHEFLVLLLHVEIFELVIHKKFCLILI